MTARLLLLVCQLVTLAAIVVAIWSLRRTIRLLRQAREQ